VSFELPPIDDLVASALAEDLGVPAESLAPAAASAAGEPGSGLLARDATSAAVVPSGASFSGVVVARQSGVVCGLAVAERVWTMLAEAAARRGEAADASAGGIAYEMFPLVAEGTAVDAGTVVAEVQGDARVVLAGERTALNALMTLSGIASQARRWQDAAGEALAVLDTRKTLPGLRALSKYAVRVGGAHNHRAGLFDMVLIKDNHIRHAGGITGAVHRAREAEPALPIEIEADTVAQASEAASAGADIVLLDNMDDATLTQAVAAVREIAESAGRTVLTEASGNIRFERLPALAATGVDRVSTSALTLAPPLDFGLDEVSER